MTDALGEPVSEGTRARVVTLATRALIPQATVLARSLRHHMPSWSLDVVVIGDPGPEAAAAGLSAVALEDELGLDAEDLFAHHSLDEIITLLVPRVLIGRCGHDNDPVVHLPASAWVLGDLAPLVDNLGDRAVLLAPRVAADPPDDGLEPSLLQLKETGRVATNLMAVDGSHRGAAFLRSWCQNLERSLGALDGSTRGHQPAQRHWVYRSLELSCARIDVATLDEPGTNVSAWNILDHALGDTTDGVSLSGRWPLRLMDLAGFDPRHPWRLRPGTSRIRMSRDPVLRSLVSNYAQELVAAGWSDATHLRDLGQRLANDLVFDPFLQSMYAIAQTTGAQLGDPLSAAGTRALMDWLRGPAARGGGAGVNRYLLHRVMRERADVVTAFPDLDGDDGRRLVAWSHTSGQREMAIPDELMPAHAGTAANGDAAVRDLSAHSRPAAAAPTAGATAPDGSAVGVRVSGYLGHVLGLGAAARGYAQALGAAGVRLSTVSASLDHLRPPIELDAGYGRHGYAELLEGDGHAFELICVNPDELPSFVDRLGRDYFQGTRIGVWGWETNSIPDRWAPAFELVDEIWVYSRFVAENLAGATTKPVVALPPPVKAPSQAAEPIRLGAPEGFLFLFAFDYSSTLQRKNPVGLVEAFKLAFAPGEGPQLLVKTINAPLLPLSEEAVLWAADGRPDIRIVDCSMTGAERDGLMSACDCYVSLHRSEGFGLTLAEAMSIGKPVIGTAYSGNVDFMTPANSYLVDYELTRVGAECQIYPADGEWAEPTIEHAARLMREVYEDPAGAGARGARAREDIARQLSPETTGAAMLVRLRQLSSAGEPDRR